MFRGWIEQLTLQILFNVAIWTKEFEIDTQRSLMRTLRYGFRSLLYDIKSVRGWKLPWTNFIWKHLNIDPQALLLLSVFFNCSKELVSFKIFKSSVSGDSYSRLRKSNFCFCTQGTLSEIIDGFSETLGYILDSLWATTVTEMFSYRLEKTRFI